MSKTVTIALAGIGGYGDNYLGELLAAAAERKARLVAAIDPQPERSRHLAEVRARDIPVFPDLASFYAKAHADLVVISAPIHFHAPLTALALANGSSVLCEKPLCATVQEAVEMAAAEAKAGQRVAIGYQWSFSPAIQDLKRDILAGNLGLPIRLKTLVLWPRWKSYYDRSPWAGALRSSDGRWVLDSPVNNATAHYLHNMLYVLGATRETSAALTEVTAELYRANPIENYDTAALRCRTDKGVEILFYTVHAVAVTLGPVFQYEFEKAVVGYDSDTGQITARFHDGQVKTYGDPNAEVFNKLWETADSVRTGAVPACGIAAASVHTLCMNGVQECREIAPFPPEMVKTDTNPAGDRLTYAVGIQGPMAQCYDQGILPSEHGAIPWARRGRTVDLRHYRSFPSGT